MTAAAFLADGGRWCGAVWFAACGCDLMDCSGLPEAAGPGLPLHEHMTCMLGCGRTPLGRIYPKRVLGRERTRAGAVGFYLT